MAIMTCVRRVVGVAGPGACARAHVSRPQRACRVPHVRARPHSPASTTHHGKGRAALVLRDAPHGACDDRTARHGSCVRV
jgi:hypothetical protein